MGPTKRLKNKSGVTMDYDDRLIEDAVLALLAAYSSDKGNAWKGFDFEIMNRLHEQGFISDPVNRNKSIWLTTEGMERGRQLADQLFGLRTKRGRCPTRIPDFPPMSRDRPRVYGSLTIMKRCCRGTVHRKCHGKRWPHLAVGGVHGSLTVLCYSRPDWISGWAKFIFLYAQSYQLD